MKTVATSVTAATASNCANSLIAQTETAQPTIVAVTEHLRQMICHEPSLVGSLIPQQEFGINLILVVNNKLAC